MAHIACMWIGLALAGSATTANSASISDLMEASLAPVFKNFITHAWEKDPQRFKNLRRTVHWSMSPDYAGYNANVACGKPKYAMDDDTDYLNQTPSNERDLDVIHIRVSSSGVAMDRICAPAPSKLMCSRISFWMAHELSHVFNEYNKRTSPLLIAKKSWYAFLPCCAGATLPYFLPSIWVDKYTTPFFLGWAGFVAAAYGFLWRSLVHNDLYCNEYNADAFLC